MPKQSQTNRSAAKQLGGLELSGGDFMVFSRAHDRQQNVSGKIEFQTNSPEST